jgi:hypothetical protein
VELFAHDGSLFGEANVVNVLVVVLVLAIVTEGAVFVLRPDPGCLDAGTT